MIRKKWKQCIILFTICLQTISKKKVTAISHSAQPYIDGNTYSGLYHEVSLAPAIFYHCYHTSPCKRAVTKLVECIIFSIIIIADIFVQNNMDNLSHCFFQYQISNICFGWNVSSIQKPVTLTSPLKIFSVSDLGRQ